MTRLKWKLVSVGLEILLILTEHRCTVCVEHNIGSENQFAYTRWSSLVTWVMWDLSSFCLEVVLASVQDRCMVYTRSTIGSEIILVTPDGTTR